MQFSVLAVLKKIKYTVRNYSTVEVYTDGGSKNGVGSWAYVVCRRGKSIAEKSGRIRRANSNTMEFHAAIEALSALPQNSKILLWSDSRIVIDTMKSGIGPNAHQNQIKVLQQLCSEREVIWQWVKAHNGNRHNERCDELCTLALRKTTPGYFS